MKISIPLQKITIEDRISHVGISLHVNGKQAFFLIDTGASRSVLDAERCWFLGVEPSSGFEDNKIVGIGSTQFEITLGIAKTVNIQEIEIKDFPFIILDLTHINQQLIEAGLSPMDGIIGNDFLMATKAVLNYRKFSLELTLTKKSIKQLRKSYGQA